MDNDALTKPARSKEQAALKMAVRQFRFIETVRRRPTLSRSAATFALCLIADVCPDLIEEIDNEPEDLRDIRAIVPEGK